MSAIDAEEGAFFSLLRCPLCTKRSALRYQQETQMFLCEKSGHRFPRIDGFPALRPGDNIPQKTPQTES